MHALAPELQRINDQNESLRRQLAAEQRRGLYQSLDTMVPDWRTIDNSLEWRQWLAQPHELSGRTRQQWLDDAMARGDAHRVASFFRGFLQARTTIGGSRVQQAPSAPTGKPTYTRAQITRASEDYRRGRIPEAEYQKLSADMHAAIAEGRIADLPMRGIGKTRF